MNLMQECILRHSYTRPAGIEALSKHLSRYPNVYWIPTLICCPSKEESSLTTEGIALDVAINDRQCRHCQNLAQQLSNSKRY